MSQLAAIKFEAPRGRYVDVFPDVFGRPSAWNAECERMEGAANAVALALGDERPLLVSQLERCLALIRHSATPSKLRKQYRDVFDALLQTIEEADPEA